VPLGSVTPPIPFDLLPGTKLALVANSAISLCALASFLWHVYDRHVNPIRGFRPFFTPVLGLFGIEHLISMYCEHYDLNRTITLALTFLSRTEGSVILRSAGAAVLGLAILYLVGLFFRRRDASALGPAGIFLD